MVSLAGGYLLLGGRMPIKEIVSRRKAQRIWGRDRLYDATEWIVDEDDEGTPLNLHRRLDPSLSQQLRLLSPSGEEKRLFFTSGTTQLDGQATRGVRELSASSAALLDRIIELTDELPPSEVMFTVTEELLDLLGEAEDLRREAEEFRRQAIEQNAQSSPATPQQFREGSVQRSLATRYERKRGARDACIAHHRALCGGRTLCGICGFEFAAAYGDEMAGFIHVHHVNQLSDRQWTGQEMSDPIKDLIPLCPNCHAVVHHKDPPYSYSVEEVRQLWQRQRAALGGLDESLVVAADPAVE
ncbi:MAG TPA: HNH endonuclease [Pirellulales bacterium]|nr:HNH endonuclease [Pirellulales bacterium]